MVFETILKQIIYVFISFKYILKRIIFKAISLIKLSS